jgi:toxin FitB
VVALVGSQLLLDLFVSSVTLAEIRLGIERLADANKHAALVNWLTHTPRPKFEQRVLPVSEDVMQKWRWTVAQGHKVGHTFLQPDLIIAATTAHHGLTMVTRYT